MSKQIIDVGTNGLKEFIRTYGNKDLDYIETDKELVIYKEAITEDTVAFRLPNSHTLRVLNRMLDGKTINTSSKVCNAKFIGVLLESL